ncbi:MAG: cytochrome C oxidase subunit IV family protein [Candidatus Thalassarchaeaceae archaeon]|jgi:heme/copper-type cytochrome/quinol oxidase subunit 4|nr:cytochrome C oxidase subunit IV family protein [Candidatus Thalassarchaeaceae archaeon]
MSENGHHDEHHHTLFGFDAYNMNFAILMIFTAIEIVAVALTFSMEGTVSMTTVVWILVIVGLVKGYGIAAIFMHLKGDPDSRVLTATALFPVFFIVVMVFFIGLTHPEAAGNLPNWCRPGFYN